VTRAALVAQIMRGYEMARNKAVAAHAERREELLTRVPRLAEIEAEINVTGLELAKTAISGAGTSVEDARAAIDALGAERIKILATLGLPPYALNVADYRCNTCADTGFIQAQSNMQATYCACFTQQMMDGFYELSQVRHVLSDENFDTFDLSFFSDELIENEGLSPRKNMEMVRRRALRFVEWFTAEHANLLLYGSSGLGKTFVCHAITKALLDVGHTVLYLPVPRLMRAVEDARFSRDRSEDAAEMLRAVDETDLLVLDDLGVEMPTIVTTSALFDIINQRLLMRKATVISTNLSPSELRDTYSDRLISRFYGSYEFIKFFGDDLRFMKKQRGGM
jgi:DNA replication protein DnaC